MPIEKKVVAIVEDSSAYADRHQKSLKQNGIDSVVLRSSGCFENYISQTPNADRIKAVITDGLEGNWEGVVLAARESGIDNIWLITDNPGHINRSNVRYPFVKTIAKADLSKHPEKYKDIAES